MCFQIPNVATGSGLLVVPALTREALLEVIEGRALALMVPNWYSHELCDELMAKLTRELWTTYADPSAQGINTLGGALFNCVGGSLEDGCTYWKDAQEYQAHLDRVFFPYLSPMTRLKDLLDRLWPGGCSTLRNGTQPAFYGLLRRFKNGGEALAHTDNSDRDWPIPETKELRTQLFANTYLSKTAQGGLLQMWNREVSTQQEYDAMRDGTTYGLRREILGEPDLVIDPPVGALVIGRARCIHAVTAATGDGARTSCSSFIGVADTLRIYS